MHGIAQDQSCHIIQRHSYAERCMGDNGVIKTLQFTVILSQNCLISKLKGIRVHLDVASAPT